jgi:hypothetical protein
VRHQSTTRSTYIHGSEGRFEGIQIVSFLCRLVSFVISEEKAWEGSKNNEVGSRNLIKHHYCDHCFFELDFHCLPRLFQFLPDIMEET